MSIEAIKEGTSRLVRDDPPIHGVHKEPPQLAFKDTGIPIAAELEKIR